MNQQSLNLFHAAIRPAVLVLLAVMVFALSGCAETAESTPADTAPAPTPTTPADPTATQPVLTPTPIPYQSPDWFDQAVLYSIFVRSFADSDGDGIGDLNGITNRLDYLETLGVDVIWLLPIHPSPSYHGYDVSDYFAVNPDYGTLEDLQALTDAAHQRGMRLILDLVSSHLSNQNPLFQEAYGNPDAENEDWFEFTNDDNTQYAGFINLREMPRFNHYNPGVVNYLTEAALYWIDLDQDGDYSDGIDGFRVDNATYPPREFFASLRQSLKAANPEILLLGEVWVEDTRTLTTYYPDMFDALFNFPMYKIVQGSQDANNDNLLVGSTRPVLLEIAVLDELSLIHI